MRARHGDSKKGRDENCVLDAVNQTNVCIIQVLLNMVVFFFSFFLFICYNFIFFFCEKVEISYGRYETQVTDAGTVEETGSVKARKHQR